MKALLKRRWLELVVQTLYFPFNAWIFWPDVRWALYTSGAALLIFFLADTYVEFSFRRRERR